MAQHACIGTRDSGYNTHPWPFVWAQGLGSLRNQKTKLHTIQGDPMNGTTDFNFCKKLSAPLKTTSRSTPTTTSPSTQSSQTHQTAMGRLAQTLPNLTRRGIAMVQAMQKAGVEAAHPTPLGDNGPFAHSIYNPATIAAGSIWMGIVPNHGSLHE